MTGDADWMVGKSRKHLSPDLDRGFLMDGTRRNKSTRFSQHVRFHLLAFSGSKQNIIPHVCGQ
jgi:hypothetical protein